MVFFFTVSLLFALLLEGTVTTFPLVLVVLLCFTAITKNTVAFPVAFIAGMFLDILTIRTIGVSSIFFMVFLFMILLYQRKYEINSYPFVFFASFLGSLGFLLLSGRGNFFLDSLISSFIALLMFASVRFFSTKYEVQNTKYTI